MIGKTISHYRIVERLGEGAMGVVYKAEDTKLHRDVALKFLTLPTVRSEEARARFVGEARTAAALDHPNICTIYEIDEADERAFIAMAFISGRTLADVIGDGPLEFANAIGISASLATALGYAHDRNVIHRDVKSANVMVDGTGRVILTDFGLALSSDSTRFTKTGTTMGTPAYMAPEQLTGAGADHRADLWALGVCLYEMLTARLPFTGDYEAAVIYSILNESPQPLSNFGVSVPAALQTILDKALEKDPNARYQTAVELRQALDHVRGSVTPASVRVTSQVTVAELPAIAVLPFANLSADPEQEYFCDGIADEIITDLSKLDGLRVAARTSAFAFKGKHEDIREIGKRLSVTAVLEGTVRKAEDRIRVTAQLVNVSDGYQVWSERFDRELKDVFAIQDEISLAIVSNLRVKLLGQEKDPVAARHPSNIDAYNLFLKGRYTLAMRTPAGIRKSVEFFEEAIALAPDYAIAYSELANSYIRMERYGVISPGEALPKAKAAAVKALEMDDSLPETYSSLADTCFYGDWDWTEAEKNWRRALEINPGYSEAHHMLGWFLSAMGRHEEALREQRTAKQLDPLSLIINTNTGTAYYFDRRHEEAEAELKATLDMEPKFGPANQWLGRVYEQLGRFDEAIRFHQTAADFLNDAESIGSLGGALARAGRVADALATIDRLNDMGTRGHVSSYWYSIVHIGLGEIDEALDRLEAAVDEHFDWVTFIKVEPTMDPLRDHLRFKALVERIGLP